MNMFVRVALGIGLALTLSTAMAWLWSQGEITDTAPSTIVAHPFHD